MPKIKAFLFDMDGVLTETSTYHFLAWKELAESLGISFDETFNESLKGISRMESLERILAYGKREMDYNEEEKRRLAEEKNNRYLERISSFSESNLFPGVLPLFEELKNRQIKIAIASASLSAPLLVKQMKLDSYVDFIADPTTVPGKPQPDLFLQCAFALNLPSSACIGVEDAQAGIKAIKAAGMLAVGIGSFGQLNGADYLYHKTSDIDLTELLMD